MAPRQDLVASAITFLQDPSVASSDLPKRIEFLQSKNLTQEEIDLALQRASSDASSTGLQPPPPQQSPYASQPQQTLYGRTPRYNLYGPQYGQYGDWQAAPPELPRRDWRDWFIMATVTSGAAYGLYTLTKRYIAPLISPPTPPQLESDKAAIDEQFSRAFALLDTLSSDTATLKTAEEARTERLDKALEEVEEVLSELRSATKRREDETRRLNNEISELKEGIPKALEGHRKGSEKRLRDLGEELKSLKLLMGNRLGGASQTSMGVVGGPLPSQTPQRSGSSTPTPESTQPQSTQSHSTNIAPSHDSSSSNSTRPSYDFTSSQGLHTTRQGASSPFPSTNGTRPGAAIPAWQMAATKRSKPVEAGGGAPSDDTADGSGGPDGERQ